MREHEDLKRYWTVEVRAGVGLKLVGKIPYKSLSEPIGYNGEREMLWPGCFAESLKRNDIYLIVSHDSARPLASSASGTLRMQDGPLALSFEADLPNTQAGRDLHESIKRGDFKKMSFGFNSIDRRLEDINGDDVLVLYKGNLLELSPVVWPAYGSTEVSARSQTTHSNEMKGIEKMSKRKQESVELADRFFGNNEKKMFGSYGEHLRAVAMAEMNPDKNNIDKRFALERAASGMQESLGSDGGFLTQPGFSESLLFGKFSSEIVKKVMTLRLQNSRTNLPVFAADDRSGGNLYEAIQIYKLDEADTLTPSDGTFIRSLLPNLNKLAALAYMTSELLEDAGTLERYFKRFMGQALSYELERQIIRGSGLGECQGLLSANCKIRIAKQGGQNADTILTQNILDMDSRLVTEAHNSPSTVWVVNPNAKSQLPGLTITGDGGPINLYKFGQPGEHDTLMGKPVLLSDHASTIGDEGDIILAALDTYLLSMMASQYGISSHVRFLNDESAFRLTIRVDGMSIFSNPVTPANGTDKLSPVITLAAR
jgi:HK97 family phage major capsid protein/HK97 family phage prohead protease